MAARRRNPEAKSGGQIVSAEAAEAERHGGNEEELRESLQKATGKRDNK